MCVFYVFSGGVTDIMLIIDLGRLALVTLSSVLIHCWLPLQQESSTRGPPAVLGRVLCGPGRVFYKIQCVMNIEA